MRTLRRTRRSGSPRHHRTIAAVQTSTVLAKPHGGMSPSLGWVRLSTRASTAPPDSTRPSPGLESCSTVVRRLSRPRRNTVGSRPSLNSRRTTVRTGLYSERSGEVLERPLRGNHGLTATIRRWNASYFRRAANAVESLKAEPASERRCHDVVRTRRELGDLTGDGMRRFGLVKPLRESLQDNEIHPMSGWGSSGSNGYGRLLSAVWPAAVTVAK